MAILFFLSNNQYSIYDPSNKKINVVIMEDKSFLLKWFNLYDALKAKVDETWLWYKRFDSYHLNASKFKLDKQMVLNLPSIHVCNDVCDSC